VTHTRTTRPALAPPCMPDDVWQSSTIVNLCAAWRLARQEVGLGYSPFVRYSTHYRGTAAGSCPPSRSAVVRAQPHSGVCAPSATSVDLQSRHHTYLTHPAARLCRDRCHLPLRTSETCAVPEACQSPLEFGEALKIGETGRSFPPAVHIHPLVVFVGAHRLTPTHKQWTRQRCCPQWPQDTHASA
jgi:hypothetical protein